MSTSGLVFAKASYTRSLRISFNPALTLSFLSTCSDIDMWLSYDGHQFLDAARSDTVWQKAKSWTQKTTGTLTLEGLKLALPHVVKALIQGGAF